MKRFLFLFILLASMTLSAQDTLYYHFYNGVQMIEIRPEPLSLRGQHNLTTANQDLAPSIYVFRNQQGTILQQYNTNGILVTGLQSPAQVKTQLRRHRSIDPDLTPKMHRYAFPGYTGFYLVRQPARGDVSVPGGVRLDYFYGVIDSLNNGIVPTLYSEIVPTDSAFIFAQGGKYGLLDQQFKVRVPAQFEMIKRVHTSTPYYNVRSGGKWGMMDRKGKLVVPCAYEEVYASAYDPGYFGVQQKSKWGVLDKKGRQVLPFKYDQPLMFFSIRYGKAISNGLYGYVDSTCTEVCPAIYSSIEFRGKFFTGVRNSMHVVIDRKGKEICCSPYEIIEQISANRFVARQKGKYGIIDETGRTIVPMQHDLVQYVEEGLVKVARNATTEGYIDENSRWVLMDGNGHRLSDPYKEMEFLGGDLIKVTHGNKKGIMDRKGNVRMALKYDHINNWYHGGIYLRKEQKHYVTHANALDKELQEYEEQPVCRNGMARVKKGHRWGYLDSTGKVVIDFQYESCLDFHKGISAVMVKGNFLLINRAGVQVMEGSFDNAWQLLDGTIMVTRDKKNYLVDQKLIPAPYDVVTPVLDQPSLVKISIGEKQGMMKRTGEVVVPVQYDQASVSRGMIWVVKDKKMGYFDFNGKEIIPCIYESAVPARDYQSKFFWVKRGTKWGVLNNRNQEMYPFVFDHMPDFQHRSYLHFPEDYLAELSHTKRHVIELLYINANGTFIGKRTVDNPQKGFTRFSKSRKKNANLYGIINWEGDTIVPAQYQQIDGLVQDHFEARLYYKYGLLDTTGQLVIPCMYDEVRFVGKTQLVSVKHNKHWGLYHASGKLLYDTTYNYFGEMPGGDLLGFSIGGTFVPEGGRGHYVKAKMGVMDQEGKVLIAPEYDYLWLMNAAEGLLVAQQGDEMCVLDKKGNTRSGMVRCGTAAERWRMFMAK